MIDPDPATPDPDLTPMGSWRLHDLETGEQTGYIGPKRRRTPPRDPMTDPATPDPLDPRRRQEVLLLRTCPRCGTVNDVIERRSGMPTRYLTCGHEDRLADLRVGDLAASRRHRKPTDHAADLDRLTTSVVEAAWTYVFTIRGGARSDPDLTDLRAALQALRVHQARNRRDGDGGGQDGR